MVHNEIIIQGLIWFSIGLSRYYWGWDGFEDWLKFVLEVNMAASLSYVAITVLAVLGMSDVYI